jgi:hypothetical protein
MNRTLLLAFVIGVMLLPCRGEGVAAPPKGAALTVENERGAATALAPADLARLPRHKAKVKGHGGPATYEGVSLADVLAAGKVGLDKKMKGPLHTSCLLVEAADGFQAVFSFAEVSPAITDKVVLVADRKDGKPLDAREGPYRLIVPHDKTGVRWVRQVSRLSVRPVGKGRRE